MWRVFELGTFIVSIVGFLIIFWIIFHYGYKPFAGILEKRRLYVESQITDAEARKVQADTVLAEHQKMLEDARKQSKEILETARLRADEHMRSVIEAAEKESRRLLEEAREQMERERKETLDTVLQTASALTVQVAEKLLRNHVTQPVHEELEKEAETRLGELVW